MGRSDDDADALELSVDGEADAVELIAYHGREAVAVPVAPASRWRDWMNATEGRSANRCLPLLMANEAGWALLNPLAFTATWAGGAHPEQVTIEHEEALAHPPLVSSYFGYGVLTWSVPMLFRTPAGYNLLARGPANEPKDGASALEGLVETDWGATTFTMNWKLTRPNHPVRFEAGEPFCVVVPQRRGELERFRPVHRDLATVPSVTEELAAAQARREEVHKRKFIASFVGPEAEAWDEWEAGYFRGLHEDGTRFGEHQTKLRLREFGDERAPPTERALASGGSAETDEQ